MRFTKLEILNKFAERENQLVLESALRHRFTSLRHSDTFDSNSLPQVLLIPLHLSENFNNVHSRS